MNIFRISSQESARLSRSKLRLLSNGIDNMMARVMGYDIRTNTFTKYIYRGLFYHIRKLFHEITFVKRLQNNAFTIHNSPHYQQQR